MAQAYYLQNHAAVESGDFEFTPFSPPLPDPLSPIASPAPSLPQQTDDEVLHLWDSDINDKSRVKALLRALSAFVSGTSDPCCKRFEAKKKKRERKELSKAFNEYTCRCSPVTLQAMFCIVFGGFDSRCGTEGLRLKMRTKVLSKFEENWGKNPWHLQRLKKALEPPQD